MAKSDLIFEEPPTRTATRGRPAVWSKKLEALKEYPEKWVRIAEFESSDKNSGVNKARDAARRLRNGQASVPESGEYEFNHGEVDGKGAVYARYMGDK